MFYMLLPDGRARDGFIKYLKAERIAAVFHYLPLHQSPMGRQWSAFPDACPVTVGVSERLVRLPFYCELTEAAQERVIERVLTFEV